MLRRTTNAAAREARESSPTPNGLRDVTASAIALVDGVNTVQGSPDRDSISTAGLHQLTRVADQFQGQPEGQVFGLRVSGSSGFWQR